MVARRLFLVRWLIVGLLLIHRTALTTPTRAVCVANCFVYFIGRIANGGGYNGGDDDILYGHICMIYFFKVKLLFLIPQCISYCFYLSLVIDGSISLCHSIAIWYLSALCFLTPKARKPIVFINFAMNMAVVKAGFACRYNAIYRCMGYVLLQFAWGNAPRTFTTLYI